jgi:hypothetical protein
MSKRRREPKSLACMPVSASRHGNAALTTQIGGLKTGWAIERDGLIIRLHPRAEVLGAWLDATLAGANEYDASDIDKAIEMRPAPTYKERLAVSPTGRPKPSRDPFKKP